MKVNRLVPLTIFVCAFLWLANLAVNVAHTSYPPTGPQYLIFVGRLLSGLALGGLLIAIYWNRMVPVSEFQYQLAARRGSWVAICVLSFWWVRTGLSRDDTTPYPNRPIEVVVPYPAGGGSDTFVRTLQKGFMEDNLLPQPLVVINIKGGGGSIGSRDVKDATPDGYRILCHHNAIITAQMSGAVDYGPEAFEPVALTGAVSLVVIVREDSPFKDLRELLEQAKATPRTLTFGANVGAPAYFTTLQLQKEVPGAEFSIVSADGGADRYAKIRGGHLDAGIFSLSEYLDFRSGPDTPPDENIRAVAVFSKQRHPAIPDVPTATEQGIPVLLSNANYWWVPKGTPTKVINTLATALGQAMQNETVKADLTRLRIDLEYQRDEPFRQTLKETIAGFAAATDVQKQSVPNFTSWVGWIVAGLFAWVIVDAVFRRGGAASNADAQEEASITKEDFVRRPGIAVACFVVMLIYVYVLSQHWLPFAVATMAMVLVVGGLMTKWQKQHWLMMIQLAALTGLGVTFIFTEVFATSLP